MIRKGIMTTLLTLMALLPLAAKECGPHEGNEWSESFCCDPCSGWSIELDWLFWKARRSGLDIGVVGGSGDSPNLPIGNLHCLEPDYDSGIRVALIKECDCWDISLRYTGFQTGDHETIRRLAEDDIFGTRVHPGTLEFLPGSRVEYVSSRYDLDLDIVELEIGTQFELACSSLSLRPFGGFKFTSIDQSMKTIYDEDIATDSGDAVLIREKLNMDAYGLYIGLEGKWEQIWCGLGAFGRSSFSLSLADFDGSFTEWDYDDEVIGNVRYRAKNDEYKVLPSFEIQLGLQYDFCSYRCVDWSLALGYQFQYFCNMSDFINFVGLDDNLARNKANLGFDGLFVRLTASY